VHLLVFRHAKLGGESFWTDLTLEGFLARVDPHVVHHLRLVVEGLAAHLAQKGFLGREEIDFLKFVSYGFSEKNFLEHPSRGVLT
jgi:hypothetical protein